MTDNTLPFPGQKVRCINNTDRPELTVGQDYVVVPEIDLDKMPINTKRFQPDDYRFIAINMGLKEKGIYPFGIFEVIK